MQLMVLAAGIGRRLRHVTSDRPKCMVEVNGKTLIERSLENVSPERFSRIVLVIGYCKEMLRNLLGNSYNGVPIVYVENLDYAKTNNVYSLYLARHLLVEDDTVLMESDLIYDKSILDALLESKHQNLVVVDKYKPHMDGTVIKIGGNDEVTAFISKSHFDYKEIDSYYKTVNIYRFSKEFSEKTYMPFLESYCKVLGLNKYYEQVLRVILTLDQKNLKALILDSQKWYEIDSIPDLHNAELLFSSEPRERLRLYSGRYGGYWRDEAVLDYCYLVNPYFPPPRMVEEIKNNFSPLMASYPSGQATQCLLAGELFLCYEQYFAIGNGAAELISALLPLLPGKIGVVLPTFNEYLARAAADRLIKIRSFRDGFSYMGADLFEHLDGMETLVLINPDNPSGNLISRDDLLQLLGKCAKCGVRLIVDESFVDFADQPFSLLSNTILKDNPHLVVIKSIGKSYGVPGFRLGVAASSDEELIKRLRRALHIWNINSFAEFFLQIAPKYRATHFASCRKLAHARNLLFTELAGLQGITPLPSQANFILCRLSDDVEATAFTAETLMRHSILLKDCTGKEGMEDGQYIRVSVRSAEDNDLLLKAMSSMLGRAERDQ